MSIEPAPSDAIRSLVIVGGGTAGWMSATYLARKLAHLPITITVVDSAAIGIVGVGEATVPAIRDFFAAIELGEAEVLRETEGTIKYGIRFADWKQPGHAFFHPFGLYGVPARGVGFHHYWLKQRASGDPTPLDAYCLCTQLAMASRFLAPTDNPPNDLGVFNFAVHFDASKFAALLKRIALANRVAHIDGRIEHVARDSLDGRVTSVTLADGRSVAGDFWIDCSGFRSLLLGEALNVPFVDWAKWLPCDRAIAIGCRPDRTHLPLTTATARPAGWQWHIPLQHRVGNGHVYASTHMSDDAAETLLRANLEGPAISEPNRLRFRAGHRRDFWHGNVVGIGLASGFLEPLESTSITLIQSGLERFVRLLPGRDIDPRPIAAYNRQSTLEFERLRDFLILHYWANGRVGEPFWDELRATELPHLLQGKIDAWRASGEFVRYEWDTFQDPSWLSMYAGFDILPDRHSPLADQFSHEQLSETLGRMRAAIGSTLTLAADHRAFAGAGGVPA